MYCREQVQCSYTKLTEGNSRLSSSSGNTIIISFEETSFSALPSKLIFARRVLKRMRLSSLVYGIVCINKRVTYITNQVLASKHDCVFDLCDIDLHLAKRLENCKSFTKSCSENSHYNDFPVRTLYCTKKSHHLVKETQCHCKLCVKVTPASLESQCVNKIS